MSPVYRRFGIGARTGPPSQLGANDGLPAPVVTAEVICQRHTYHRHFTHEERMPFYVRFWNAIRRYLRSLLGFPGFGSHYTAHPASHLRLPAAYTLLEYIGTDTGRMLSETWERHRSDQRRRQRLFRGLSSIICSLARVPQPRIGSFRFEADRTVTLSNRPLLCNVAILENEGAPRTIDETYICVEPLRRRPCGGVSTAGR
ncbi:hypothetical protein QBC34DRAFT_383366 [Podospora aff. communis PSN243]|uniref:Uncharacterized protein n=1 Tax=Podospora aff. communis PSN243 TaxID=3040156 RepID=A0AAV9GGV4_9PEZI|nr:hypothetical protein QBC34DRAFT_383366 [Podospora aff. communis PSN243]